MFYVRLSTFPVSSFALMDSLNQFHSEYCKSRRQKVHCDTNFHTRNSVVTVFNMFFTVVLLNHEKA